MFSRFVQHWPFLLADPPSFLPSFLPSSVLCSLKCGDRATTLVRCACRSRQAQAPLSSPERVENDDLINRKGRHISRRTFEGGMGSLPKSCPIPHMPSFVLVKNIPTRRFLYSRLPLVVGQPLTRAFKGTKTGRRHQKSDWLGKTSFTPTFAILMNFQPILRVAYSQDILLDTQTKTVRHP